MRESIEFGPEVLTSAEESLKREWLETNGVGGFASSTIWGMDTRRHHGLLTAATKPPVGRMVLLSKLEEAVLVDGKRFELSTNRYPGVLHPRGFRYLVTFRLDPFPVFRYDIDGIAIEKTVFMVHGENTTVVQYTLHGNRAFVLEIRPLMAFRDSLTHEHDVLRSSFASASNRVMFWPYDGVPGLYLAHEDATIEIYASGCCRWRVRFRIFQESTEHDEAATGDCATRRRSSAGRGSAGAQLTAAPAWIGDHDIRVR